jgi:hypothetical protein
MGKCAIGFVLNASPQRCKALHCAAKRCIALHSAAQRCIALHSSPRASPRLLSDHLRTKIDGQGVLLKSCLNHPLPRPLKPPTNGVHCSVCPSNRLGV